MRCVFIPTARIENPLFLLAIQKEPTKPTTRIQEAKLVERPRHVRRSVRKREVGVVQAFQPHFITVGY